MQNKLNVPNLLSIFRMVLIPVFIVLYLGAPSLNSTATILSGVTLAISGITDLLDGVIARKFNMITNLGKILDPLADKLTQVAVVICVAIKMHNPMLTWALMIFVVKEFCMLVGGAIILKKKIIMRASKWYGKVATAVFYVVMVAIALFESLTQEVCLGLILVAAAFMLFAFCGYISEYLKIMKENKSAAN